jgi:hypothetical protein
MNAGRSEHSVEPSVSKKFIPGRGKRKPTTYFLEKINRWFMPVRVDFCPYRSLEVVRVPSFPHLSE